MREPPSKELPRQHTVECTTGKSRPSWAALNDNGAHATRDDVSQSLGDCSRGLTGWGSIAGLGCSTTLIRCLPHEQPTVRTQQGPSTLWPMGTLARDAHLALSHQQAASTHARQAARVSRPMPADARSHASVRTPWWRCRESNPGPCRIFPFFYVRSRAVAVSAPRALYGTSRWRPSHCLVFRPLP